ncbi:hypothetical protein H1R20_g8781, partial [Candolleomyces eurysporus]
MWGLCYLSTLHYGLTRIQADVMIDEDGSQAVHIAPEAYDLAVAEFGDSLWFWEASLPRPLTGGLASLSGRKVLLIDGQDPFVAVDRNANITGGYQSHATRQNSYHRGPDGWEYSLGNFATHPHPLTDEVELTIEYPVQGQNVTVTLPYRSRFGSSSKHFTDSKTLRENNCIATPTTNGLDLYGVPPDQLVDYLEEPKPLAIYQQQPILSPVDYRERHPVNVLLDGNPLINIGLPETLAPSLEPLNSSYSVAEFFMLKDNKTGVLALGSFSAKNYTLFGQVLLDGLKGLKRAGAEQLIVDVTNNGGGKLGYICIAHWLHRIIIGPKDTTVPQAGLDTTTRAGPLAQLIAKRVAEGHDPDGLLLYNPTRWTNATNEPMPTDGTWLEPHKITMSKEEGVRTAVVGGKQGVQQHYCGIVGGQSTDFSTIDTEIKSTKLKNHTLAPPDLLTNHIQGITWRLGYGIDNPTEPEEWQDHDADISIPLTRESVNNPVAIWETLTKQVFEHPPATALLVQDP